MIDRHAFSQGCPATPTFQEKGLSHTPWTTHCNILLAPEEKAALQGTEQLHEVIGPRLARLQTHLSLIMRERERERELWLERMEGVATQWCRRPL